jgi:hypothetical protein
MSIDGAIKRLNPGELLIDDLGYFKQEAVMDIDQRGAYFLYTLPLQPPE